MYKSSEVGQKRDMQNKFSSLTEAQQHAVDAIVAAPQQGKRAASYGHTILNRKARVIGAIRRNYEAAALAFGFTAAQAAQQWQDIKDVAVLEEAVL